MLFEGSTHLLIPLYAVGVFIDFTISQTGMIRHWLRERSPGWRRRLAINAFGAVLTGVVAVIVTAVKFFDGAWLVLLLIPILVGDHVLHPPPVRGARSASSRSATTGVLPGSAPRAAGGRPGQRHQPRRRPGHQLRADADARRPRRSTSPTTSTPPTRCGPAGSGSSRTSRSSSSSRRIRAVISPFLAYLDILDQAWPPDKEAPITIVVLPEYVARHWWDRLLYNQTAKRLKAELVGREHTVIADVPYRRGH